MTAEGLTRYEHIQGALARGELHEPFTHADVVDWFRAHSLDVHPDALRQLIIQMCVNSTGVAHGSGRVPKVLYRIGHGVYRRHNPETDGVFVDGHQVDDIGEEPDHDDPMAFALERYLEEFMADNWRSIRQLAALDLVERQFQTSVGTVDFLCRDRSSGHFVIVELKRGRPSDAVIGQCLRYMGWVKQHLAADAGVRGLIISHEQDEKLHYALAMAPNVEAWVYRVRFELTPGVRA